MAHIPFQRAPWGGGGPGPTAAKPDGTRPWTMPTAELLADHAGPAVLFDGAGTVLAANGLADPIVAALRGPLGGELRAMLDEVLSDGGVPSKRLQLPIPTGQGVFDITLLREENTNGDRAEEPSRVLLLARDSTFDVNFSRALVASRQLFKDLVSCSADFSWETDTDGCFTFISGRGLLGYSPDELDGRPARQLLADFGPDQVDADGAAPNPFESLDPMDEVECWLLDRDGARACVRTSCLPVVDEAGTPLGVRGVCSDITEDKMRQTALNRAQERERLSRSIVDSIRDALTPEEMFAAAAAAIVEATGASHAWILRDDKAGGLHQAAGQMASGGQDIDIVAAATQTFAGDQGRVERIEQAGHRILLVPCHFHHHPKGILAIALNDEGALEEAAATLSDVAL